MQLLGDGLQRTRRIGTGIAQLAGGLVNPGFEDLHTASDAVFGKSGELDARREIVDTAVEPAGLRPALRGFRVSRKDTELQCCLLDLRFEIVLIYAGQSFRNAHGERLLDAVARFLQGLPEAFAGVSLDGVGRGVFGLDRYRETARMTDYDVGSERRLSAKHVGLFHPDSVRPARMPLPQRFGQIGIECGLSGLGHGVLSVVPGRRSSGGVFGQASKPQFTAVCEVRNRRAAGVIVRQSGARRCEASSRRRN